MTKPSKACDVASERAVLSGTINFGGEVYLQVADLISENTFTLDSNQIIWKLVKSILDRDHKTKLDISIITAEASTFGLSEYIQAESEFNYLRSIIKFAVEKDNVEALAIKLKKLEIARKYQNEIISVYKKLDEITGQEDIFEIVGKVENPIFDISSTLNNNDSNNIQHVAANLDAKLKHREENPCDMVGIPTGFPQFDESIGGGLRRKGVSFIAARPKIGKSSCLNKIALHIAGRLGIPVLNLDTEMDASKQCDRMLACLSEINIREIETGKYSLCADKKAKIHKMKDAILKIPYDYINVAGKPFDEIIALARRWIVREVGTDEFGNRNPCVVMLDYLKLMDTNEMGKLAEHQALGFNLMSLNNLCIRYDVPCLAFLQLNRDGITSDGTEGISQSDRIAWFCESISMLKEKSEEEIQSDGGIENGNRKLVNVIARSGPQPIPGDYINLHFQGEYCKITEGKRHFILKRQQNDSGFDLEEGGQISL